MAATRALTAPLSDLLHTMAEEGASDETSDFAADLWAGLLRDGAEVARRIGEEIEGGDAPVTPDEIDPVDWAALQEAVGVIVTRDNHRGVTTARTFDDETDMLAAWDALKAEIEPSAIDVEVPETGDSTEGPSSGPRGDHEAQ